LALILVGTIFVLLLFALTIFVQTIMGVDTKVSAVSQATDVGFYGVFLLATYWCTVRRYHVPWSTLGLRRVPWWWLIVSPVCLLAMLAIISSIMAAIGAIQGQQFINPQFQMVTHGQPLAPVHLVLLLLSLAVAAPIVEELFFRGMLYPLLRRSTAPWLAVILNAAVFALAHGIPILLPVFFVSGVVFAMVRERANSVLPGMLIHALQNTLFVLTLYAAFH
jgi:membrane protease YdiL (CAAX protease family)